MILHESNGSTKGRYKELLFIQVNPRLSVDRL